MFARLCWKLEDCLPVLQAHALQELEGEKEGLRQRSQERRAAALARQEARRQNYAARVAAGNQAGDRQAAAAAEQHAEEEAAEAEAADHRMVAGGCFSAMVSGHRGSADCALCRHVK